MDKKIKKPEDKMVAREDLKKTVLNKDADEDIHKFLATHDRGDSRHSSNITQNSGPKHSSNIKTKLTVDRKILNETRGISNLLEKKVIKKTTDDKDRGDLAKKQVKVAIISKAEESKEKIVIQPKCVKKTTEKVDEFEQSKPVAGIIDGNLRKIEDGIKTKILPQAKAKFDKLEGQNRTYLDLEGRKWLRERYTVKLKNNPNYNKNLIADKVDNNKETAKNDEDRNKHMVEETTNKLKPSVSVKDCAAPLKSMKKQREPIPANRKPIISTIRRNDNRIYKAVTFVEQKTTPAPLQIKIPHDQKSTGTNSPKFKTTGSKVSVQIKSKRRTELKKLKDRLGSPIIPMSNGSPPTEVAKWAPSSISRQTKPYYEAWVDTTLAAINKCSKNEKMYLEKQDILRTFKRAWRPDTPDLVYENINDERYTGKIVIRKR